MLTLRCRHLVISTFNLLSFVVCFLLIVLRRTINFPSLLLFAQMCVNPRKLNVSGFSTSRATRFVSAKRPNSMRRVLFSCKPIIVGGLIGLYLRIINRFRIMPCEPTSKKYAVGLQGLGFWVACKQQPRKSAA